MEFVDYNGNDITSAIMQPNDNILFNADFLNGEIINQKGEDTYSFKTNTVTVDGWVTYGPNVDANGSNYLRFVNRQSDMRSVRQPISGCEAGNYTVMIYVKSVTGNVYVDINKNTVSNYKLVSGVNIFTINKTENLIYFSLNLATGADISIYKMKLEQGTEYTGMPIWNRSEELLKCYRYGYLITAFKTAIRGHTNQLHIFTTPLPVKMNKTPTVTEFNTTGSYNISNPNYWADATMFQVSAISNSDNMITININRAFLDAYTYYDL